MAEKLEIKSSVSEQSQIISTDADGNVIPNPSINVLDTPDKEIFENIILENIPIETVGVEVLPDGAIVTQPVSDAFALGEPTPLTEYTESDTVSVLFDRKKRDDPTKRLQFLYDYTLNNERIRLLHTTGTYWEMRPDGSYIIKTKDDFTNLVGGHLEYIVGGDYSLGIKGKRGQISAQQDFVFSTGKDFYVSSNGSIRLNADAFLTASFKEGVFTSSSNFVFEMKQAYIVDAGGDVGIKSKTRIILEAPEIVYNVSSQTLLVDGGYEEKVMGARTIAADGIYLTAQDGLNFVSAGDSLYSVVGIRTDVISGVSQLPSPDTYVLSVQLGNWVVEATVGNITQSCGPGGASSQLSLTLAGVATLKGLISAVLDAKTVSLGSSSASESILLGSDTLNWLKDHKHFGTNGDTGVAIKAPLPKLLSKKVFFSG